MSLKKQLQDDLKAAMRSQDAPRKAALRMVLAAIQYAEVGKTEELGDEDTIAILQKEVRRREEALEMIKDAGRHELVNEETIQIEILQAYLPKQLTVEELTVLAQSVVSQVGATSVSDLGVVMQNLMPLVKGKADGRVVNQVVRMLLTA